MFVKCFFTIVSKDCDNAIFSQMKANEVTSAVSLCHHLTELDTPLEGRTKEPGEKNPKSEIM